MVTDNTNRIVSLMPDRHPQHDLFICDVADAVLKDMMAHMEYPFYSLSKKTETSVRQYDHNGHFLEITPSVKGLATIYDKDILIYCIRQIIAKMKAGDAVSQRVRINSRDLLIFTNRGTSGRDYMALIESLDRLEGTRIRTNIITGDEEKVEGFGLLDASPIRRKHGLDGRRLWCEVKLSDWVFRAIQTQQVLALHGDYFRLRKPIERRVYEIARKHCGQQKSWEIGIDLQLKKTGSQSPEKRFRQMIRHLVEHDHLTMEEDLVAFTNRGTMTTASPALLDVNIPQLDPDTYHEACMAAPGWAVLEREWETEAPRSPDAAFIGFCSKVYQKRGHP